MATVQSFGVPNLRGQTVEELRRELQAYLQHVANTVDALQGNRGTIIPFRRPADFHGNQVGGVAWATHDYDACPRIQVPYRDTTTENYNAQGVSLTNLAPGTAGTDAVNLDQILTEIRTTLAESAAINASYITVTNNTELTQERSLAIEATVLTLTDAGANSTLTVGVAANGITNAKFRQSVATSLVGRSANSMGDVADIAASADGQILQRASATLGFSATPTIGTSVTVPTVIGSTSASGTLSLSTTSHATKGKLLIGSSAYDEANNRLGIAQASPAYPLDVTGVGNFTSYVQTNGVYVTGSASTIAGMSSAGTTLNFRTNSVDNNMILGNTGILTLASYMLATGVYVTGGSAVAGLNSSGTDVRVRTNSVDDQVIVDNSGNTTIKGTYTSAAPTGGAGAWKLGVANAVSPTSPNRTITIDIGGTPYYLHAKTTND